MYKLLITVFICLFFYNCGNNNSEKESGLKDKNPEVNTNVISQKKIKGMYESKNSKAYITDCENGSLYLIAQEGDVKFIDSIYNVNHKDNSDKKLYVVAEGFNSVKENPKGGEFDSVIVITKVIGTDLVFDCLE